MASVHLESNFLNHIKETRKKIQDSFKRVHETLQVRESNLFTRIDEIENGYKDKSGEIKELLEDLNRLRTHSAQALKSNQLADTNQLIRKAIDDKIAQLTADIDCCIEFEWDTQLEANLENIGKIKLPNTFPLGIKPIVPDYKAKQLSPMFFCNKSSNKKTPGELNNPTSMVIHYKTGNLYIADGFSSCVKVFSCNGDYLFKFSQKMSSPRGICISQNKVFVSQYNDHCINIYELEGKLIKSFGSEGSGEAQFNQPQGLAESDTNNIIYVCDKRNNRVQILTQELRYHSLLGNGLLNHPRDVKVTRDKVLVLDCSDPCLFVFTSEHVLMKRLITRGSDKQTISPYCFDIDRDYNIVMSDYSKHCVCVFNEKGEQAHKFGKQGQEIGEFNYPYGIVLDNTGHIVTVSEKNTNCLQFF